MSDPLERYLDDFGTRLGAAASARPRRRRRATRPVLAVAAAAIVAVIAAVVLTGSGEPLDPVAEAQAALDPPGEIVYLKTVSRAVAQKGITVTAPAQKSEQWSTAAPRRWRFVVSMAPRKHGPPSRRGGERREYSYAAGELRGHRAGSRIVSVLRGIGDDDPSARLPSLIGSGSGDPAADLRAMLFGGTATITDEGEVDAGGRTVHRLVSEERVGGELRRRLVYDVDPQTFAPVAATLSMRSPIGGGPRFLSMRIRVDAYKRIPLNAETARLLRFPTPPGVRLDIETVAQQRRRSVRANKRRAAETCIIVKRGGTVCGTG